MDHQAADRIYEMTPALAGAVVDSQFRDYPELAGRYGPGGRQKCIEDTTFHFWHLAEAIRFDAPELFIDYVGWVKILLNALHIGPDDLCKNLQYMRDASQALLAAEIHSKVVAHMDRMFAAFPSLPVTVGSFIDPATPDGRLAADYLGALLARDPRTARNLVVGSIKRGVPIGDIYDNVIVPCLREVGRLWQLRKINEVQEHYCSQATHNILALLSAEIDVPMRKQAVIGFCVAGEQHSVGLRLALDCFALAGWDTHVVGADTPTRNLDWIIRVWQPAILAISVTMTYHLREACRVISAVRAMPDDVRPLVLVGGRPFSILPSLWRQLKADMTGGSCANATELVNERLKQDKTGTPGT